MSEDKQRKLTPEEVAANVLKLEAEARKANSEADKLDAEARQAVALATAAELEAREMSEADERRRAADEFHKVYRFSGPVGS
ncbi:MAG: hypothetical protein GWO44_17815, partial [Thermoplasmata archaeon]|nr:hypothetical protein [Thermoplasmata archaeon]NIY05057.1 hypothetical protein [Thermoplasmata archaeon]